MSFYTAMDRSYPITLDQTSIEIGEDYVTEDHERIADFTWEATSEREPSEYFGPISNRELFQLVFGRRGNQEQRYEACWELRQRMLAHYDQTITERAVEALQP